MKSAADPREELRQALNQSHSTANTHLQDTQALDWADNAAHLSEQHPVMHGLKGAPGGGTLGALGGAALGGQMGHAGKGALIGGGVMGALGGYLGATAPGRGKQTLKDMSQGGNTPVLSNASSFLLGNESEPSFTDQSLRPEHQALLQKLLAAREGPKAPAASAAPAAPAAPKAKPAEKKAFEGESEYYTMKVGDNPWVIAMKHHMKVEELLRLNGLNEEKARKLKPGDRLRIK